MIIKVISLAAITRACLKSAQEEYLLIQELDTTTVEEICSCLEEHFLENVESFNNAVFNNGLENKSFNCDIFAVDVNVDLVYFDPPYLTSKSDNDYTRRYHFVEGLVKNWKGLKLTSLQKQKV